MAISSDTLSEAVDAARRFLAAADKLRRYGGITTIGAPENSFYEGGKFAASVKRSSLDLSRALSEMRRA